MKYIITESRLHDFMTNYLNNMVSNNHEIFMDSFIVISPRVDEGHEWVDFMEYDYSDGRLWIERDFLSNFGDLFALDKEGSLDFIKKWFEDKFGVDIKYVES